MDPDFTDILTEQPAQGQRVLVKMLSGEVRITTYDRFCYAHWPIKAWKPMPNGQNIP